MIRRYELTDEEWEKLQVLLPSGRMGRPREDDRRVLNGDRVSASHPITPAANPEAD